MPLGCVTERAFKVLAIFYFLTWLCVRQSLWYYYSLNYTYVFYLHFDIFHDKQFLSAAKLGMCETEDCNQSNNPSLSTRVLHSDCFASVLFSFHFNEIRAWNHTRCIMYVIHARKTSEPPICKTIPKRKALVLTSKDLCTKALYKLYI